MVANPAGHDRRLWITLAIVWMVGVLSFNQLTDRIPGSDFGRASPPHTPFDLLRTAIQLFRFSVEMLFVPVVFLGLGRMVPCRRAALVARP